MQSIYMHDMLPGMVSIKSKDPGIPLLVNAKKCPGVLQPCPKGKNICCHSLGEGPCHEKCPGGGKEKC